MPNNAQPTNSTEAEQEAQGADAISSAPADAAAPAPVSADAAASADVSDELVEARDQLLRAQAELENARKRFDRELDRTRTSAIEGFARDLLSVLDDIRRAQTSWQNLDLDENVQQGLDLILATSEKVLSRHQITRMEAESSLFDPNLHEALFEDSQSDKPAGTITQVIEEGYQLGDRLLRAARVAVAGAGAGAAAPPPPSAPAPDLEKK